MFANHAKGRSKSTGWCINIREWFWSEGTQGPVAEAKGTVAGAQGPVADTQGTVADAQGPVAEAQGPIAEAQGPVAEAQRPLGEAQGALAEAQRPRCRSSRGRRLKGCGRSGGGMTSLAPSQPLQRFLSSDADGCDLKKLNCFISSVVEHEPI